MPTPDSKSLSDVHTPIEPDFDAKAALQQAAAQRAAVAAADGSLSGKETDIGGVAGESDSAADLKAAADHLDDVWFESVDLAQLYEIGDEIGRGGMGIVYRAIGKQNRLPFAIKRLMKEYVGNRRSLLRFQSEGNAMLKLTHDNIVRFYRMGRDSISPFFVMELVEGGSLKNRLDQGKLELNKAIRMFAALASGLAESHRRGIIHRDIKPGNILLTLEEKPTPKLSDFGIAKQLGADSISLVNAVIGTQSYMSPEQSRGEKATERSDLFSLAKTLYHAVTGELPNTVRESRIPEPIREITLKALEDDPSLRHSTVAEFAAELRSVQMQLTGPANISHDSAQLKDGECPHCHTINPLTRKFCKAKGCGKPLVEPCPKCETPSPVWEAICAECGTDIPAHWEAAEQDLENQAQQIETLAAEQRYANALEALKPFHSLTATRWQAWKKWASENTATYQAQLIEQQALRDRFFAEATEAFQAAKYSLVTSLLDQLHATQNTPEIRSLRAWAAARSQELDQLIETIKQQVKTKDYEELRRNVNRVLEISPGDQRVAKLDGELRTRDESIRKKQQEQAQQERLKQEVIRVERIREELQIETERQIRLAEEKARRALQRQIIGVTKAGNKAGERTVIDTLDVEIPFRWCPPGKFQMGSPSGEAERAHRENQVHVELTRGFWLGETVVTQELFRAVLDANPSHFKGSQRPVEKVSWKEAQAFCHTLTHQLRDEGILSRDWRVCLPTEARWEYACRAGTATAYFFGNDAFRLGQFAWFDGNSNKETHPVGTREANPWGLRDMSGNVWEWCNDWYGDKLLGGTNPGGPSTGSDRVIRGGSWCNSAGCCRSAYRDWGTPSSRNNYRGFRVCLSSD